MSGDEGDRYLVSDTERADALASLVRACGAGAVTLEDFSRRTDAALAAGSHADLIAVTADLPAEADPAPRLKRRWLVPFGNRVRRGRFVLPERTTILVLMGEVHLDLRGATLVGPAPTIRMWALMGNLRVLAPRGITVEVDASSIVGERELSRFGAPAGPGAPVLRIRMLHVLGAVKVTDDPAAWSPGIAAAPGPAPGAAGPPAGPVRP